MQFSIDTNKNNNGFNYARLLFLIAVVFIVFSPDSSFAKTLKQYHENVRYARDLTISMLYPDEEESAKKRLIPETDFLTKIRKSIAGSEKIETEDASIETDNWWLTESLSDFEREPRDSPKRRVILTSISERLEALNQKLDELENASASNNAGDQDKQKLSEILRREEYQKTSKEDESFFQKILRQLQEIYRKIINWLESFFPHPNLPDGSTNAFQSLSFILQMIIYALVLGVIAFLIYKFAPFISGRFRRKEKSSKQERVILGERISAEETAQNLFAEAESLAREGNLRGAIRKGYVALLCELSERKIIGLSQNKTNRDYLRDVRGKVELYQNMNGLTLNFERHWYGFEFVEAKDWEEFREGYERIIAN